MTEPPRTPDERPSIEVVTQGADWILGLELAGKYRVDYFVAEGGFGAVYAGVDLRLDVPVAIKILKTDALGAGTLRRQFEADFLNETRIVARLRHPHVVRVHDVGVTSAPDGAGVPWMAMEWLDGETLQQVLRRRREARLDPRMAPAQAVALLRPVLDAIAYAHEQRVAHRDLKPANIMLVPARRGPVPYVLDFGVAKAFEPSDGRAGSGETATRTPGEVGFTAAYAAIEQVTRTRTGPWTDVHALALILTELLVGRKAYEGEETPELLACAFREERPTPAHFGVDVGPLEPVLRHALSLRAGDRYPDAQRLLDAVDAALAAMGEAAPGARAGGVDPAERSAPQASMRPIERPKPPRRPARPASWADPLRERALFFTAPAVATALVALWLSASPHPGPSPAPPTATAARAPRPAVAPASPTIVVAPAPVVVTAPPPAVVAASPRPARHRDDRPAPRRRARALVIGNALPE